MNNIMHGTFNNQAGYEYYMQSSIMKILRFNHEDNITSNIKGCIAGMIVNRKCVLTKLINKRAEKSHQKKIITKRTYAQDGTRKNKSKFYMSLNESADNV